MGCIGYRRRVSFLTKFKSLAPPAALALAPYFLKGQKVGKKPFRHFTAPLRGVPCSARFERGAPNSLRSNMRRP